MSINVPGYQRFSMYTPFQSSALNQLLGAAGPNINSAAQGYLSFLPGGGGGEAIRNAANQNFQQYTIPSILNTFGTNVKGSSALNQALAAGAANLNTDVSSQLAKMMLEASHGLGQLGTNQAQIGAQKQFGYAPKEQTLLQQLLLGLLGGAGQGLSSFARGAGSGLAGLLFA